MYGYFVLNNYWIVRIWISDGGIDFSDKDEFMCIDVCEKGICYRIDICSGYDLPVFSNSVWVTRKNVFHEASLIL